MYIYCFIFIPLVGVNIYYYYYYYYCIRLTMHPIESRPTYVSYSCTLGIGIMIMMWILSCSSPFLSPFPSVFLPRIFPTLLFKAYDQLGDSVDCPIWWDHVVSMDELVHGWQCNNHSCHAAISSVLYAIFLAVALPWVWRVYRTKVPSRVWQITILSGKINNVLSNGNRMNDNNTTAPFSSLSRLIQSL